MRQCQTAQQHQYSQHWTRVLYIYIFLKKTIVETRFPAKERDTSKNFKRKKEKIFQLITERYIKILFFYSLIRLLYTGKIF
jgi:fucose permease